ncbi:hypothetical protein ACFQVA_02750 [Actinomadura keratinilytica]
MGGHQGGARVLPGLGLQRAVGERLAEPATSGRSCSSSSARVREVVVTG